MLYLRLAIYKLREATLNLGQHILNLFGEVNTPNKLAK